MINFDEHTNENKIEQNLNWPYIPDAQVQEKQMHY